MARGTTLAKVCQMVKAQAGIALGGEGSGSDTTIAQLIADKQDLLNGDYDWPFLYKKWDVAVSSRYTTFPTLTTDNITAKISFEREVVAWTKLGDTTWLPVDFGIGVPEYNVFDSDNGIQSDPIQKWAIYNETQLEVWPVPIEAQTLRFYGQKVLTPLVNETGEWNFDAPLDLDDLLLALFVASDMLAAREQKHAMLVMRRAEQRFINLRAAGPRQDSSFRLGPPLNLGETKKKIIVIGGGGGGSYILSEGGNPIIPG
jgi:hypothetical protein